MGRALERSRIADLIQERDRTRSFTAEQVLMLATIFELETEHQRAITLRAADLEVETKLQALDRIANRPGGHAARVHRFQLAALFIVGLLCGGLCGWFLA